MRYDPEVSPDPVEWLATPEADRLAAVRRHHQRTPRDTGNPQLHAAIHAVVETQLAERHPAATDAMSRLVADGLRRHEALHAIGSVVAAEMFDIAKAKRTHDPEASPRQAARSSRRRMVAGEH
jgi:hypothetical protein